MSHAFEATIEALWTSLGLPSPGIGAEPRAALTIDGRTITLSLAPDETSIVIATDLGSLARDPVAADQQLRRLMRDSAGLMLLKRAALRLRPDTARNREDIVAIEALGPCRPDAVAGLTRAIEDLLVLAEAHGETLRAQRNRSVAAAPLGPADLEGSLIFRL